MKSRMGWALVALLSVWASFAQAAGEKQRKLTLGVFLPTTMTDGQERFRFAEKLAAGLGAALGEPVVGRSFGRYEDFAKAASDGSLDLAVVDGWAAAASTAKLEPIALGAVQGETHPRWAVVSTGRGLVKDLRGKRLAIIKGAGPSDAKFVTHAVFAGDLEAQKHFGKLVTVPSVESALKVLEVKSAEAVLIPALHAPKDAQVLFRSNRLLGAVVVSLRGNRADEFKTALRSLGAVEPFEKFSDASADDVADFRKLIQNGPPKRQPAMAESPGHKLDTNLLVSPKEIGPRLPSFVESMEISKEQPDD
ncbi:MAG TPA: hypothetical protein VK447_05750 [Myxococcaceae bacterium]|nr:hypothetical protein [Myxococcaceae bacterium]